MMVRLYRLVHTLLILAFLLAACSGAKTTPPAGTEAPAETLPAEETPAAEMPGGGTVPTATPSASSGQGSAGEEQPLYLALVWHQHQPLYYKDVEGVYTRPWVRVHATKDYYDMASTVQAYPDVHVTFNLTPVLIRQLDDFAANGAKDKYWVLAEKPAAELTEEDRRFILERFFDTNRDNIISRFPRYLELLEQRGGATAAEIDAALASFSEADFRDLQIWFNLAWFDPDFLAQEPLKTLVDKGRDFSEADKATVFDEARRIIGEVIPLHKQLQDAGQIEVITTPYAHPILPLIYDTDLATVGNPDAEMPELKFSYPNDAIAQLQKSVEIYQSHFGRPPRGLWPGEGAVAQEIVSLVAKAGYEWMATGEPVLAANLGLGTFSRDAQDTVQEADQLYRPYDVQGQQGDPVMIIFRDWRLSDQLGFEYSQTPGEQAAQDFMDRLERIRQRLAAQGGTGPHLVSVILDGENAWENYPNDGKEFLNALYRKLAESQTVKTVTPSEYRALFPERQKLDSLFPGAWFSANYDTWIGEPEEKRAWEYLAEVREDLAKYDILKRKEAPSPEALAQALDFMYLAEGSDWFWWYGGDQDSGNDAYFDEGFRALLSNVYTSLGEPPPAFVNVPIIPERPETPAAQFAGLFTPTIDGKVQPEDEWAKAAAYQAVGGAMARAEDFAAAALFGLDAQNGYIRVDAKSDWAALGDAAVGIYIFSPRVGDAVPDTRRSQAGGTQTLLGFGATNLVEVELAQGQPTASLFAATDQGWEAGGPLESVAVSGSVLEIGVPLATLGEIQAGDDLRAAVVISQGERDLQKLPATGPAQLVIPDLGLANLVLEVEDPQGDDRGPGEYTYPTDAVFEPGVFDLKSFSVGYDDANLVFKLGFYGPVPNPWGSPNGLAVQTLDVYVDKDPGAGTGARLLLPGRNAALEEGSGWEYAIWAEGWTPQFVAPDANGVAKQVTTVSFKIIVDPASSTVTLRVPREAFGEGDPAAWGYTAAVMSQDGFPSPGVWRIRNGQEAAEQWRFGGVPAGATNYPRIFDIPDGGDQAAQLAFIPSTAEVGTLGPDDYAQVKLLIVK